jgi:NAD(P)H dehydrogenase (quinone)
MRVLIVHAHHEPQSFNAAMTREATAALIAAGSEVIVSDLYAMQFDPVSDRRNFVTMKNSSRLRQQDEEAHAAQHNGFAPALQTEMDKLTWCDTLILQFPLWWFGMPAILKGWIDRVFAVGRAYGDRRWFDVGVFAGKRAMCSVTVGGLEHLYSDQGINGPMGSILFPINHGILGFTGFAVIEPFVVYGPTRITDDERVSHLRRYRERVVGLDLAPIIAGPNTSDYDENLVLKTTRRSAKHHDLT